MMDATVQDILKMLLSSALVLGIILWWLNRPKQKKEIANIVGDTYYKMTERLQDEIALLDKKIESNEAQIEKLEKQSGDHKGEITKLKKEADECRYQHIVKELEILQLKKHTNFSDMENSLVCVIDDDPDVLEDFRTKFAQRSTLDFMGFLDVDEGMNFINTRQPPIVVFDYNAGKGKTAEDISKTLTYTPEIFIISGLKDYEQRFVGKKIRFFHKDDHLYVYKILEEIIKHLIGKANE